MPSFTIAGFDFERGAVIFTKLLSTPKSYLCISEYYAKKNSRMDFIPPFFAYPLAL